MNRFENKVALVSGAANGIGRATALRLAAEGARVYAVDLVQPEGLNNDIVARSLDVRSEASWQTTVSEISQQCQQLDVLVNCAGILRTASVQETTMQIWQDTIDTNLTGSFLGVKCATDLLAASGQSAVVNMASINALRSAPNHVAYAASKGGVMAMTMTMAMELAPRGIRVNALAPGTVDTPMVAGMFAHLGGPAEIQALRAEMHPVGRISSPEEQAATIAYLCSDEAGFITGVTLPTDGGRGIRP